MPVGVGVPIVAVGLDMESDSCVHQPRFAMEGRYTQVYFGAEQSLIERAVDVQSKQRNYEHSNNGIYVEDAERGGHVSNKRRDSSVNTGSPSKTSVFPSAQAEMSGPCGWQPEFGWSLRFGRTANKRNAVVGLELLGNAFVGIYQRGGAARGQTSNKNGG
ncbi:hypothetical protein B0H13DRAFT_1867699 [Mycena leptocephala]|nr:hypothetical protein B0H13DRAFT_1867699 [Mycena leptocephala]